MKKQSLEKWINDLRDTSLLSTKNIPLSTSKEWSLSQGVIVHTSNRFFSIIGVEYKNIEHILIDQQEIGTLGFLIHKSAGITNILVQAKAEPGNIKTLQFAPSCQATSSNAEQVHGGNLPPFLNYFTSPTSKIIYNSLQSEQGSRFYKKRNTNCIIETKNIFDVPQAFLWTNIDNLLELVHTDYSLNTDARSVLVSAPWEILVERSPFSRYSDDFSKSLSASFNIKSQNTSVLKVKREITETRNNNTSTKTLSLNNLSQWKMTDMEIFNTSHPEYKVTYIDVNAPSREVKNWDQPIIESSSPGIIILECGKINNILHFGFISLSEVGLYNHTELSPTVIHEPGSRNDNTKIPEGIIRAATHQSEEGGRFFRDSNYIQLIDIGEVARSDSEIIWLSLQDIAHLLREDGWFTNEARTALSLLLAWL